VVASFGEALRAVKEMGPKVYKQKYVDHYVIYRVIFFRRWKGCLSLAGPKCMRKLCGTKGAALSTSLGYHSHSPPWKYDGCTQLKTAFSRSSRPSLRWTPSCLRLIHWSISLMLAIQPRELSMKKTESSMRCVLVFAACATSTKGVVETLRVG
jgi:hypothetical protein